ncbi:MULTISPECIES: DUF5691 domain-containing protein [unclassified Streptomyces]|uniref:DUF5691 domain-containing protein n=1 Tax=unclassified Streptomyces TaxID=2593676 RepID=UPI00225A5666|nr:MULTISPECIES: DUF5691 domain-containing protein [unclassified Streptomyces]MCX5060897.1 DUF5691 domain-containing protein [Streptomyces sp. NBC_00452]MCX5293478.1 DUF5691 domain-containing protein [Streptomyces sp. NBC_00183]
MNRTSTPVDAPAPGAWEELVTVALLGTERRTPPGGAPGREAPVALLDAAAAETVRRRAGLRPGRAARRPEPASEDPRPALPAAAARRLSLLLTDRPGTGGGRRGTAPDLMELLPQWLATANARGFAAPPQALPALLDAARGRTDLRPAALTFAGPRAVWLARLNPDWRFALRATPGGGTALPHPEDTEQTRRLWEEGLFAERVALLSGIRAREPAAARELLTTTWSTERAEDRLMFLDSLRAGLGPQDEPFLEQALADRSRNVRATAAELLSALPGSALAARMAVRAAACVAVDRTRDTPTITVEAPHECDASMERDGVAAKAPAGRGERSWWFGQLVEATPLGTWSARLGGRTPRQIVALPVTDDWQGELHAAWCRAAVRQREPEWARALLGTPSAPEAGGPGAVSLAERAKLLGTLSAAERADWVAGFIATHGLSEAFQLLGVCAVPWTAPLGRAVVDALDIARDAGSYPWSFSGVMGLAERCLDPGEASRLDGLLAIPDEPEDASPGAGGYWAEAFQRLVTTLRLRAVMVEELGG